MKYLISLFVVLSIFAGCKEPTIQKIEGVKCKACDYVFRAETTVVSMPEVLRKRENKPEFLFDYKDTLCDSCSAKWQKLALNFFKKGKAEFNKGNYDSAIELFGNASYYGYKEALQWRAKAQKEQAKPPLELIKAWVGHNIIGNPEAHVIVKNASKKKVDAFTIGIYCYDRFDKAVNEYGVGSNRFGGLSQNTISPGKTFGYNRYWTLFGHENTAKIKVELEQVHMTDGTTWTPQGNQKITIEGVSKK
jgi:hypothetical protein